MLESVLESADYCSELADSNAYSQKISVWVRALKERVVVVAQPKKGGKDRCHGFYYVILSTLRGILTIPLGSDTPHSATIICFTRVAL